MDEEMCTGTGSLLRGGKGSPGRVSDALISTAAQLWRGSDTSEMGYVHKRVPA